MQSSEIKAFFKRQFGINVRVRTVKCKHPIVQVWIPCKEGVRELEYDQDFPDEVGNKCLNIVYPNSPALCAQNWAGNFNPHSLSFRESEWVKFRAQYPD